MIVLSFCFLLLHYVHLWEHGGTVSLQVRKMAHTPGWWVSLWDWMASLTGRYHLWRGNVVGGGVLVLPAASFFLMVAAPLHFWRPLPWFLLALSGCMGQGRQVRISWLCPSLSSPLYCSRSPSHLCQGPPQWARGQGTAFLRETLPLPLLQPGCEGHSLLSALPPWALEPRWAATCSSPTPPSLRAPTPTLGCPSVWASEVHLCVEQRVLC